MTLLSENAADSVMSDALDAMNDLAIAVREDDLDTVHAKLRTWVNERPEHAAIMLAAAACLIDPDEPVKQRRARLERIALERVVHGV